MKKYSYIDKIEFVYNLTLTKTYPSVNEIRSKRASGTGFALTSTGLITTNYHVVEGASKITVKGIHGNFAKSYSAKILTFDKNNDLAIIKIEEPSFSGLGTIPYTISNRNSEVGSSVFVLG